MSLPRFGTTYANLIAFVHALWVMWCVLHALFVEATRLDSRGGFVLGWPSDKGAASQAVTIGQGKIPGAAYPGNLGLGA